MKRLKAFFKDFRIKLFYFLADACKMNLDYKEALQEAIFNIKKLSAENAELKITIGRLDQKHSLDVRSNLDLINFDALGEIVWIKVSDDRMLRYDVFSQVKDYMRSHGKSNAILLLTGTNVELKSLTEEDLIQAGLCRVKENEHTI